ncbi:MAG TPA: hypothetical protein VGD88_09635 [Opitutaceae bacterium]
MTKPSLNARESQALYSLLSDVLSSFSTSPDATGKALVAGIPRAERRAMPQAALRAYVKLGGGR